MARRNWFSIQNAASAEAATLTIYDEIGFWGITAKDFKKEFSAITAPVINLEINSPGGSVFDGIAIYNMLKASGKTINAKVMGVAASIASVILMAADKITMPANSMVMIHKASGGAFGNSEDMRDMAEVLDKIDASIVATYVKRTGKSEDEINAMLAKDTWLTADEAKAAGFADEVIDSVEAKALFDIEQLPESIQAVFKAVAKADPAPAPSPAPAPNTNPVASEPVFAERVNALATEVGMAAYASVWALACTSMEEVVARVGRAREITALCKVVNMADSADAFIRADKPVADVRTELANKLAEGDKHIDTTKPNQPSNNAGPSANPTAIWAKRHQQTTGA